MERNDRKGRLRLDILGVTVLLAVLAGVGLTVLLQGLRDGQAQTITENIPKGPALFKGWQKPDVAILVSGQMHGYLQPCGCSEPQYGGLIRRYNCVKSLREKDWPLVAVDLGDIATAASPQAVLKYTTAMKVLNLMGYSAIAVGKNEFYLPLEVVEGHALNNPMPRVLAANLSERVFEPWIIADKVSPKIGIIGLIGPSVVSQVSKFPNVKFAKNNRDVIDRSLKELGAKKPELVVMLYEGTFKEAQSAAQFFAAERKKNAQLPNINIILCLEEEEEPSGVPRQVEDTWILGIGHKGRYVGVIGAYRDASKPTKFALKYQLVSMGPELNTPKDKLDGHPVMAIFEEYAKDVKQGGYLTKFPRTKHPVQLAFPNSRYVGSERCADCHPHAFKVWSDSRHSHAFKTLVDASPLKYPPLRHFDGECVSCHTVGFNYQSGFADPTNTIKQNQRLINVGCESCHGPCSAHESNPQNVAIHKLINPYKSDPKAPPAIQKQRQNQLDHFCQKCHDIDNDVNWGKVPFHVKWVDRGIIHMTPKK
ncbi:MAG: hypothetical protein FJ271_19905 [Planctomycetes bacterium]|nr:hypothetical protein [Planctomycetota bacterium]